MERLLHLLLHNCSHLEMVFVFYGCIVYTPDDLGFLDCVLPTITKSILACLALSDRCKVFITVLAQADRRHFAYAAALDCGLKNKTSTFTLLCFL